MCYTDDARPPIPPSNGGGVAASQDFTLRSADGTEFMAYAARAAKPSGAGMVILPDIRGLHDFYKELARRFAEVGIDAVAFDYFGRTAGLGSRDEGFECVMSSNGAILDERRGNALLEADLRQININVGDEGEDYEDVYKLPFEKTLQNVLRFKEMAGDDCQVNIVLVDYKRDRKHIGRMVKYWQAHGLNDFVFFDIMNRGGALFDRDFCLRRLGG